MYVGKNAPILGPKNQTSTALENLNGLRGAPLKDTVPFALDHSKPILIVTVHQGLTREEDNYHRHQLLF